MKRLKRITMGFMIALMALAATAFPGAGSSTDLPQGQSSVQTQRPGPPGTIRVRVRLIPVDVIVTDSNDRPVAGLKAEDFQIFENGRLQDIRHFAVQTFSETAAPEPEARPLPRPTPTAELVPQTSRTFLILMGRARHQRLKALDSLIRFVRNDLLPQDRLAVFAYNRATDFTTNHEKIAQTVERYKTAYENIEAELESRSHGLAVIYGSKEIPPKIQSEIDRVFDYAGGLASRRVPPSPAAKDKPTKDRDAAQILMHGVAKQMADTVADPGQSIAATENEQFAMDAITGFMPFDEWAPLNSGSNHDTQNIFTCLEYLRYMEGEKHLLFFTEQGLFVPYGNMDHDFAIGKIANDARVAIDTFHTGGIYLDMGISKGPVVLNKSLASPARDFAVQGLKTVSELTGGRASIYNDIGKALKSVNEITRMEYLLGYYPKDEDWNGKYRQIKVKVNRPGLRVSYRHGYIAGDKLQPYDREEFLTFSRVAAAGFYAGEIADIPFTVSTAPVADSFGQPQIKVDLLIDAARIGLTTIEGRHLGKLQIAIYYADAKKNILGELWSKMEMNLSEENYQRILQSGLPFSRQFPLKVPGQIFKVIIYDPGIDKVGSKLVKLR